MWHASVAYMYDRGPIPTAKLHRRKFELLKQVAKELLEGVGENPSKLEQYEVAIHYRKTLTEREIARLSMDWCAIPAIDESGEGILLEEHA